MTNADTESDIRNRFFYLFVSCFAFIGSSLEFIQTPAELSIEIDFKIEISIKSENVDYSITA